MGNWFVIMFPCVMAPKKKEEEEIETNVRNGMQGNKTTSSQANRTIKQGSRGEKEDSFKAAAEKGINQDAKSLCKPF